MLKSNQFSILKRIWNAYGAEPVKLTALRSGELVITLPKVGPSAGTKLMTPGGIPTSSISLIKRTPKQRPSRKCWINIQHQYSLVNQIVWEHCSIRRFPQDYISLFHSQNARKWTKKSSWIALSFTYHEHWGVCQISTNSGKIEGRNGCNKSFKSSVTEWVFNGIIDINWRIVIHLLGVDSIESWIGYW